MSFFLDGKLKAFAVYLPVPFCLITCFTFSKIIANVVVLTFYQANVSLPELLVTVGRGR